LIAYFIGNTSAKKYQNPFTCVVRVIASQMWDVFETWCIYHLIGIIIIIIWAWVQPTLDPYAEAFL